MTDFAAEIKFITYKEVAIMWGITNCSAKQRLHTLRKALGKEIFHRLTPKQYCEAEDITLEELNTAINNYYSSFKKHQAA